MATNLLPWQQKKCDFEWQLIDGLAPNLKVRLVSSPEMALGYWFPWQPICYHGNQNKRCLTGQIRPIWYKRKFKDANWKCHRYNFGATVTTKSCQEDLGFRILCGIGGGNNIVTIQAFIRFTVPSLVRSLDIIEIIAHQKQQESMTWILGNS